MSKITMQDIADALGISRVTVWNALNNRSGLSEELRTSIFLKAAELGYKKIPFSVPAPKQKNISLIICQPEGSWYWNEITHRISKELSRIHYNLIYTYLPEAFYSGYMLPYNLSNGSIDGAIIINAFDLNILQLLNALCIPKVFLDTSALFPLSTIKGDIILLEGEETIEALTNHLIENGREDLAFIGDIHYCRTNYDRYLGYVSALEKHHLPISSRSFIQRKGVDCTPSEIQAHLSSLSYMPDAFICVNDYIASTVTNYMINKGYQIPKDAAITGFDKMISFFASDNFITSAVVEADALAKRIVSQLLFRLDNPAAAYERIYICCEISYGTSTDF